MTTIKEALTQIRERGAKRVRFSQSTNAGRTYLALYFLSPDGAVYSNTLEGDVEESLETLLAWALDILPESEGV